MSSKGCLVVISGPSGVGKTTLCQRLLEEHDEITSAITCTTRAPRSGEKHGEDYYFLSAQEFEEKIKQGQFVEHAFVHGHHYGTLHSAIEKALSTGQTLLLNIDVQGAKTIRNLFPEVLDIFIDVQDQKQLRQRLEQRSQDSAEIIEQRLRIAEKEQSYKEDFTKVVYNDDLDHCYKQLKNIIIDYRKEHHVG